MRFSTDPKKKKIEKRIWAMLVEIAVLRSGGKCEFPNCKKAGAQRDHCFSSMVSRLRFDYHNISNLCAGHHTEKTFCVNGAEKVVDAVVRKREGAGWFDSSMWIAQRKEPFRWTITALEDQEKFVAKTLKFFQEWATQ